jgi:hypothetical protein
MTPLAVLHMWSDVPTARSCRILVFGDAYHVEIRSGGEPPVTVVMPSMDTAMAYAEQCRPKRAGDENLLDATILPNPGASIH